MVLEDSQDNAEAVETLESYTVNASDFIEATPARPEATVAKSASAIFPCSMVSPWLRDKAMSNSLDKILALVSTQLLQKADKTDNIPMQMQMQQQQQAQQRIQQQQNMMNMMMMSIMSSMLNHGTSQTTTSTTIVEPIQAMMNSMIALNVLSMQQSLQSLSTTTPSTNAQPSSSASIEFQTPNDNW